MTTTYIDVRTPDEFAAGHYPGAINHPLELIAQGIMPDVPHDTAVCVYCRSGARAGMALQLLQQAGYTSVSNGRSMTDLV